MKFTSLALLCMAMLAPAHASFGETSSLRDHPTQFPRVYSAIVPIAPDEHGITFAAQVDLLDTMAMYDTGAKISFLVHDQEELSFIESLRPTKLKVETDLTEDLQYQRSYDDNGRHKQLQNYDTIPGFSCYKSVEGTFNWMSEMVIKATEIPGLSVTISDIGDSYLKTEDATEGDDMLVMKITGNSAGATEKGIFFAMSGIHAREYAPVELVSRWADSLINSYGNDADITAMLDHTEIHLVLQSNPDGRKVAETDRDQFRRKNLNPGGSIFPCMGGSYGVDLNRNFPFRWGSNGGSSGFKCSQTYRGASPASEPEVKAIVDYCESIFPEGQRKADPEGQAQEAFDEATTKGVFFDVHSFTEIIIWPWAYEERKTGNDNDFYALAQKYRHFNGYDYSGPDNGFLYEASGVTDDWAYGELGAAAVTFELGTAFYQDCDYFEDSILQQNMGALTYAAKTSMAPYSLSKGPDVTSIATSVTGDSLTVTAVASDDAYSSSNHPSSQQEVEEIRMFVNEHPDEGQTGTLLAGTSSTVDISNLPDGRHMVYVQAKDSDGYKGPVTAAYFTKGDVSGNPSPVAPSPVATPVDPVAAPTDSPVLPSPVASAGCADSERFFYVDMIETNKNCQWLTLNTVRFSYLCDFLDVASTCPVTCNKCEYFTFN